MKHHLLRAALLLLLAACGAMPATDEVPEALRKFADAAQFLAPGLESYEFAVVVEPDYKSEVERWVPVLLARCGSDFQKPKELGTGRYRGVEVRDFGTAGVVDTAWSVPRPPTRGATPDVWAEKGDGLHFDRQELVWHAVVDERFVVRAYEREALEAALTRAGKLREIVRPFDALALVPGDADRVLCLLPRAKDEPYWGRPLPTEPMVVARCATPKRVLLLHRLPLPESYAKACSPGAACRTVGDWTIDEVDGGDSDDMRMHLWFSTLFGLAIFY